LNTRRDVAREAARLLYTGTSSNYKDAKEKAARSIGTRIKPSNYEVALELDSLAEKLEGDERRKSLAERRRTALKIMQILSDYSPSLIGSVWRGTAHKGSDIDVEVYGFSHPEITSKLEFSGYKVEESEKVAITKQGKAKISIHVILRTEKGFKVEVVIRHPNEIDELEKCEIYGDAKKGLRLEELKTLVEKTPYKKFIPRRR
jgi:predicted nucleotidyltransferase